MVRNPTYTGKGAIDETQLLTVENSCAAIIMFYDGRNALNSPWGYVSTKEKAVAIARGLAVQFPRLFVTYPILKEQPHEV